jgi:hypothetical protein
MAGRPKKLTSPKALHIFIPEDTIAGLDAWVAESQATLTGGSGISRASLIRDLLRKAVEDHVAEKKKR